MNDRSDERGPGAPVPPVVRPMSAPSMAAGAKLPPQTRPPPKSFVLPKAAALPNLAKMPPLSFPLKRPISMPLITAAKQLPAPAVIAAVEATSTAALIASSPDGGDSREVTETVSKPAASVETRVIAAPSSIEQLEESSDEDSFSIITEAREAPIVPQSEPLRPPTLVAFTQNSQDHDRTENAQPLWEYEGNAHSTPIENIVLVQEVVRGTPPPPSVVEPQRELATREPVVPAAPLQTAVAAPQLHSSLIIEGSSDSDDDFFPSPVTPPAQKSQVQQVTVVETPQPLRQLFQKEEEANQQLPPSVSPSAPAVPSPGSASKKPQPTITEIDGKKVLIQPEMDFSVEPIDSWFEREEQERRREKEIHSTKRQKTQLSDETIKRLSRPKSKQAPKDAVAEEEAQQADANTKQQTPMTGQGLGMGGGSGASISSMLPWNQAVQQQQQQQQLQHLSMSVAASDRPNETHCYFSVNVLHACHHIALPKKSSFAVIAEALSGIETLGVLRTSAGNFISWSDSPAALGMATGLQHCSTLRLETFVEFDEEQSRSALIAEYDAWRAHRLAFSEWVLRCSTKISRHIFFDATGDFIDVCP